MAKQARPEPEAGPQAAAAPVPRRGLWIAPALALAGTIALALWWARTPAKVETPSPAAGAAAPAANHVDNAQCVGCHAAAAQRWQPSHHAMAMALPTAETVRGNFDNAQFKHQGISTRFFKRGDKYFVNTDGPGGKMADFEVKYSFGLEPLQQYLIETTGGRLQPLTIAWNTRDKQWFHLFPKEKTPPGDVLHWTGRYQTGNTMCISCHTTHFEKRYDAQADTFDSRWSELGVSCQSCHGPGSRHAEWARLKAEGKAAATQKPPYALAVDTRSAKAQVEGCVACHSRRAELTPTPTPGAPQLDNYLPSLLREGLYHADGQQLDEVYVDGSFRQSKMYLAGVSCMHCHDAHTAKTRLPGNALCLQCHQAQANPAFPAAAGNFDSPAHHHHRPGTPGAECVACHMPAKNYMQVQARPDHSLRVPRPDLTLKIGTPNACNQCHDKKTAQWAADAVTQWYGPKTRPPHYGEAFAAARAGLAGADAALAAVAADMKQPPIVRASAIDMLRSRGLAGLDARIEATRDADAEVRAAAASSLEALPASQRVPALAPLLKDPIRAVRIAAARSLSSLPADQFDAPRRAAFDAALAEYIAAQSVSLDMPGSNLNLGVVYENTGRDALAEQHYLAALKIDPDFTPARANLSRFYSAHARNADAESVLRGGLKRQPELGELQYSLGLLLAEDGRLPEAAQALARAAKLMPQRARVHYNLGLAQQQLGQAKAAEAALLEAQRLDPADPAMPYALAVLYAQGGKREQALLAAARLQQLRPGDAQANQLIRQLGGSLRPNPP